jgi:dihydrolipoamide dehydrogenase
MTKTIGASDVHTELVVIGSGPGGYTAAFRAADLGMKVTLIDRYANLGGVCLNVGCIPSKALLHVAKVIDDSKEAAVTGLYFNEPKLDLEAMKNWKNKLISGLTTGLKGLADKRNVTVLQGSAYFISADSLKIDSDDGESLLTFEQCIIAAGSEPVSLKFLPDDPRIIDSTDALNLTEIPNSILIVGGGIIGLEMATIYSALGSEVSIVELTDTLMSGTDQDLVKPLERLLEIKCEAIFKGFEVTTGLAKKEGIEITFKNSESTHSGVYDVVLVTIGRVANGNLIDADRAGVEVGKNGIIPVDHQMRTNVSNIFAIGDVVGEPMLAHKASHEAKIASEVAAGINTALDTDCIPSVAYTDPEVAWVGLTENKCLKENISYEKGIFPWAASGRSLTINRSEGLTKLLFEPVTKRLLGGGIVGTNAGELIAEIALAIEMDCNVSDVALTVHPHPSLSETLTMAAEAYEGTITDLYLKK